MYQAAVSESVECFCRRSGQGPSVLHDGARFHKEDRDPAWRGPMADCCVTWQSERIGARPRTRWSSGCQALQGGARGCRGRMRAAAATTRRRADPGPSLSRP